MLLPNTGGAARGDVGDAIGGGGNTVGAFGADSGARGPRNGLNIAAGEEALADADVACVV
jgi:hypothetical protein